MAEHPLARHRNALIAGSVVLFHVGALWALQSGLLRRAVEVVVPVQLLSEFITPAIPQAASPPPPKAPVVPPRPAEPRTVTPPRPNPAPPLPAAPQPLAVANAAPSAQAPVGVLTPQPPAPPVAAPVSTAPVAPAPVKVDLPSTNADYLNNPKPVYPLLSKRAGEQGRVLVHVLIGADGLPQKADIKTSSGFERLDQSALATVLKWRYVPGKRAGVAEAMWFNVPINFVLE